MNISTMTPAQANAAIDRLLADHVRPGPITAFLGGWSLGVASMCLLVGDTTPVRAALCVALSVAVGLLADHPVNR